MALTDVREATEVWIAIRRSFLNPEHKPCICGKRAFHELLGIGVQDGNITAEQMAARFCRTKYDVIFPAPVNVAFWDDPQPMVGGYCPVTGEPFDPDDEDDDATVSGPLTDPGGG